MGRAWGLLRATIYGTILLGLFCRPSAAFDSEDVKGVVMDFLALINEADGSATPSATGGGRRLQQFFGDLDAAEIFDDFFDDFEIAASLSDFVDNVFSNPFLDFAARLPQSQEEAQAMVRAQYAEYCSDEEKIPGGKVGDSCNSWITKLELTPGKCDVVDRVTQQFACDPPMLVYTRMPPACTSRHTEPAEYTSKECKVAKAKGVAKEMVLGGGVFDVRLKLGLQDAEIISNLDLSDFADILDLSGFF